MADQQNNPYAQFVQQDKQAQDERNPYAQFVQQDKQAQDEQIPYIQFAQQDKQAQDERNPYAQFVQQDKQAQDERNPYAQFVQQDKQAQAQQPTDQSDEAGFFNQLFSKGIPGATRGLVDTSKQVGLQLKSDVIQTEKALQDAYAQIDAGKSAQDVYFDNLNEGINLNLGQLSYYERAKPERRSELSTISSGAVEKTTKEFMEDLPELLARQDETARKYAPRVGELTEVKSLADFRDWLGYNIGASAVQIVPVVGAGMVAGPYGAFAAGTTLTLGETIGNRLDYILGLTKELPPEEQAQAVIEYLEATGNTTVLTAMASGTLDIVGGPVGTAIRKRAARILGKEVIEAEARAVGTEVARRTTWQAAKEQAKEFPLELLEEGITGGLQETAQIIGQRVLEEQTGDFLTEENIKRIVNAAAAEAVGSVAGSGFNISTEAGRQFFANRVEGLIREQVESIARQEQVSGSQDEIQTQMETDVAFYMSQGMTEEEATLLAAKGQSFPTGRVEETTEEELDTSDIDFEDVQEAGEQDALAAREDAEVAAAVEQEDTVEPTLGDMAVEDATVESVLGDMAIEEDAVDSTDTTTAAAPGTVRLYRVEATPEQIANAEISTWVQESPEFKRTMESEGRWFTDDPAEAAWYLENEYPEGRVVAVDVPVDEAERFRVSNMPVMEGGKNAEENPRAFSRNPEKEFFIPKETAAQAQVTTLPASPTTTTTTTTTTAAPETADAQVPGGKQDLFKSEEELQAEQAARDKKTADGKKAAGSRYDQRKSVLNALSNVVAGVDTNKVKEQFAAKGLTQEDINEFDANFAAARDEKAAIAAIEARLEGRASGVDRAKVLGRRETNRKIALYNEYRAKLASIRTKRIRAIADALELVNKKANATTTAYKQIQELLADPSLSEADMALAKREYEQRKQRAEAGGKARFVMNSNLPPSKMADYDGENENMRGASGDVSLAIKAILADPKTPRYMRALINYLQPALAGTEVVVITYPEQFFDNDYGADLIVSDSILTGKASAVQASKINPDGSITPVIYLNALGNTIISGLNTNVVAHEMIHAATAAMLDAYKVNPNSVSPGTRKAILQLKSLHTNAIKRMEDKYINGLLTEYQMEVLERALVNEYEFMSYGLTDPTVQEFLLDMPPDTMWAEGQSWNGLSYFTKLIRRILGIPAGQMAAFDNLVDLTGRLVKFNEAQKANRPPTTSINFATSRTKRTSALAENLRKSNTASEAYRNVWQMLRGVRSMKDATRTMNAIWDSTSAKSLRVLLQTWTTDGITRFARNRIAALPRVNQVITNMAEYRGKLLRELHEQVPEWEKFIGEFPEGAQYLSDTMHVATLNGVDPSKFGTRQETIAKDPLLVYLRAQLNNAQGLAASKLRGKITARTNIINETFSFWEVLQRPENGGQRGVEIYKMAKKAYEKSHNMHMRLLIKNIRDSKLPEVRKQDIIDRILNPANNAVQRAVEKNKQLDAEIAADPARKDELEAQKQSIPEVVATYQAHNALSVYFPLMRYGDYFLSVGTGKGREFYMFESESARNDFAARIAEGRPSRTGGFESVQTWLESGQMQLGDNKGNDLLRREAANASEDLKNIFQMMGDPALINSKDLQDQVYQLYLKTLPGGDLRRKFIHRSGIAGYSRDTLRNFVSSQHNSANQLARLRFGGELRLAMASMYASLKGHPDQVKLRVVADEIAKRAMSELKPATPNGFDTAARWGNKIVFLWMMSGIKSALVQSTQLAIVGTPVLMARFGGVDVSKVMARYSVGALTGKVSTTRKKANGEIVTEWGQPSIRWSEYVTNNGEYGDDLARAWEYANQRGFFMDTYAKDMTDVGSKATKERLSLPSKATNAVMDFMTGGFHHMERVNREIMYMSSFELAYNERLKNGVPREQAVRQAMDEAMKLAYEGLFNYSNYNKPTLFKNPLGRLAFQFMTFPLQMTSYLYRNFIGQIVPLDGQGRKEAAAKFWGTLGMTWLFAGSVGMPLYSAFAAAVDGIRELFRPELCDEAGICPGDPDYEEKIDPTNILGPVSFDLWFRGYYLPSMFGPGSSFAKALGLTEEQANLAARIAEVGPISALIDLNVGASTSLNSLFFTDDAPAANAEEAMYETIAKLFLGPTAGLAGNLARASDEFSRGDYNKALESLMPAALRNPMRSYRFLDEGLMANDGDLINPPEYYSNWRLFGQFVGFQDTTTAQLQRMNFLAKEFEVDIQNRRNKVLTSLYNANLAFQRDTSEDNLEKIRQAETDVMNFNYQFPYNGISRDTIISSLGGREENRLKTETYGGVLLEDKGVLYMLEPFLRHTRPKPYGGSNPEGVMDTLFPDEED